MLKLLLAHDAAVEYWERGHLRGWRAGRFAQPQAAGAVPCEVKAMLVVDHQVPLPAAQALLGHLGADHGCLREKMGQVHAALQIRSGSGPSPRPSCLPEPQTCRAVQFPWRPIRHPY